MNEAIDIASRTHARRPSRVAWLVLLALATLQLAIAQHASAHALDDLGENCALCLKLDDSGKAASAAALVVPIVVGATAAGHRRSQRAAGRSELVPDSRAPPSP